MPGRNLAIEVLDATVTACLDDERLPTDLDPRPRRFRMLRDELVVDAMAIVGAPS
ncbi:MAG: hypothetical protein JW751_03185 [Polyangiaceae bacterium]|nr:hypothetical protein [Polyangiaceae bacterium]